MQFCLQVEHVVTPQITTSGGSLVVLGFGIDGIVGIFQSHLPTQKPMEFNPRLWQQPLFIGEVLWIFIHSILAVLLSANKNVGLHVGDKQVLFNYQFSRFSEHFFVVNEQLQWFWLDFGSFLSTDQPQPANFLQDTCHEHLLIDGSTSG